MPQKAFLDPLCFLASFPSGYQKDKLLQFIKFLKPEKDNATEFLHRYPYDL